MGVFGLLGAALGAGANFAGKLGMSAVQKSLGEMSVSVGAVDAVISENPVAAVVGLGVAVAVGVALTPVAAAIGGAAVVAAGVVAGVSITGTAATVISVGVASLVQIAAGAISAKVATTVTIDVIDAVEKILGTGGDSGDPVSSPGHDPGGSWPESPNDDPTQGHGGPDDGIIDDDNNLVAGDIGFLSEDEESKSEPDSPDGKPIILDLDGDGVELIDIDSSTAFFDINGDGYRSNMGWVAADDGLLAYDKDGDGDITAHDEISFVDYVEGATTDLEGLAHFDTNVDGVLDSQDAEFAKFGVWQDLDQDGETDPGEFRNLTEAGITAIDLSSDGVHEERGGNAIFGFGAYTKSDGTTERIAA